MELPGPCLLLVSLSDAPSSGRIAMVLGTFDSIVLPSRALIAIKSLANFSRHLNMLLRHTDCFGSVSRTVR